MGVCSQGGLQGTLLSPWWVVLREPCCPPCTHSSTLSPLQKQTGSLVMVNFYNDYVACQREANLSQVAGRWM